MLRPAIVSGTGIVSRRAVLRVMIRDVSTPAPEQAIARESSRSENRLVLPNSLKFDLYMEHFMDGKLVGQAFGTVPATDPASIASTEENGQTISLTAGSGPGGDTSWTSVETYPKADGKTMSLTVVIKKTAGVSTESTIPATVTYQIGDTKMAENLVAVRFMTDNMVKAAH